nr:retrotransposon-related protein [Tanacetum cinerariifolium]
MGKDEELRKDLLAHFHSSSVGGHSRVKVTTHRMSYMLYCKVYVQSPPVYVPYLGGLSKVDAVDRTLKAREQAIQMLKFHLNKSQNRMKQQADKRRSDKVVEVGDWVFLKLQPHRQFNELKDLKKMPLGNFWRNCMLSFMSLLNILKDKNVFKGNGVISLLWVRHV